MPNKKTHISEPNDPLVLHVISMEFEPNVHFERRKLTVDIEIPYKEIEEMIKKLTERRNAVIKSPVRVRFIGTPV